MKPVKFLIGVLATLMLVACWQKKQIPDAEITAISKEAYIYGVPMVANYKAMYNDAIDAAGPGYKKPFNVLHVSTLLTTPADPAKETEALDVATGSAWLDLRAEPLVLTVPGIEAGRYYSVQLSDLNGYNTDYISSRTNGSKAGRFMITAPGWTGNTPEGIERVIQADTMFAHILIRVQRVDSDDMTRVENVLGAFTLQPLSQMMGAEAPATTAVDFPAYSDDKAAGIGFFDYMNFLMQFMPPVQEENEMIARFDKINIGAGKQLATDKMSDSDRKAYQDGISAAIADLDATEKADLVKGADMHGTRAELKSNYLNRAYGARHDLFGASPDEILSIVYKLDSEFKVLNGAHHYSIRFEKDRLPPANAFWSLTLYGLPEMQLSANDANRYHITSEMVSGMITDPADGSLTVFVQKAKPGDEPVLPAAEEVSKTEAVAAAPDTVQTTAPAPETAAAAAAAADAGEAGNEGIAVVAPAPAKIVILPNTLLANWLPAPDGDFYMVLRIYQPKEEALNGTWKEPVVLRFGAEEPTVPNDEVKAGEGDAASEGTATDGAAVTAEGTASAADAAQPADAAATAAPVSGTAATVQPAEVTPAPVTGAANEGTATTGASMPAAADTGTIAPASTSATVTGPTSGAATGDTGTTTPAGSSSVAPVVPAGSTGTVATPATGTAANQSAQQPAVPAQRP